MTNLLLKKIIFIFFVIKLKINNKIISFKKTWYKKKLVNLIFFNNKKFKLLFYNQYKIVNLINNIID